MRPTVRLRLTAWYASIFLLGGAVLLAISYVIVSRNATSFPARVKRLTFETGIPGSVGAIAVQAGSGGFPGTKEVVPPNVKRPDLQTLLQVQKVQQAAELRVTAAIHRQTAIDFALALAGTTLVSLLAGWVVAGRALRPVAQITTTARRVAAGGDLGERIGLEGPADELRELGDTFDAMLERLDRTFASQRSFVANASHELRTPLAIMRAEIEDRLDDPCAGESELREMATVLHDAVGRSEALITSLLTLARGQDGLRRQEPVNLADVARVVVARNEPDAAAQGIGIEIDGGPAVCCGDRELLERLVANLVENALRYNEPGGSVRITTGGVDGHATLRVSNSGEPVRAATIPRLFEPFVRGDTSRSRARGGAGLGLSIVAAVAATHGGTTAARVREGGGLVVTVSLPAHVSTGSTDAEPRANGRPSAATTSGSSARRPGAVRHWARGQHGASVEAMRLLCSLGLHRWQDKRAEDGEQYRQCGRCGKDKDLSKPVIDIRGSL
jgi:signal transduction histidine kinase